MKFFDGLSEDTTETNLFLRRKVDGREGHPTLRWLFDATFVDSALYAYRVESVIKLFEIMEYHEVNGMLAEYFESRGLPVDEGFTIFDMMKEHDADGTWDKYIKSMDYIGELFEPASPEAERALEVLGPLSLYLGECKQAMWVIRGKVEDQHSRHLADGRLDLEGLLLLMDLDHAAVILRNTWLFTKSLLRSQLEDEPETGACCCEGLYFNRDAAKITVGTLQLLVKVFDDRLLIHQGYEAKDLLQAAVDSLEASIPISCQPYEPNESDFPSLNK